MGDHYNLNVQVYAISCVPFRTVCQHFDVHAYPRLLLFRSGETEPINVDPTELHPYAILGKMGLDFEAELEEDAEDNIVVPLVEGSVGKAPGGDHFLPRRKKDICK